jgi:hypothetical protein
MMIMWLNLLVLAQVTTSPDEKLVGSFNAFVSAINTIATVAVVVVALLSLVVAIGLPIWLANLARGLKQQTENRVDGMMAQADRDVNRAIGQIDVSVQEQVRLQVETLRRRTRYLENLLAREATVEQTMVNYFVPNPLSGMPEGYQILSTRGFLVGQVNEPLGTLDGDIVVLDLTHSRDAAGLDEDRVKQHIQETTQAMRSEAVLVVYVRGQFPCIRDESNRRSGFASANFLIPFVGTVVNSAYVVSALKQRRSN